MRLDKSIRRGVATIADIRERCIVDPVTHCWHWQGGMSSENRLPAIFAFCHERGEKRVMPGTKAVWNIAHGRAPLAGWLVMRGGNCSRDCLNPVHLREVKSRGEVARNLSWAGKLKGVAVAQKRAAAAKARAAKGAKDQAPETVAAIRALLGTMSQVAIAAQTGVSKGVVNRIAIGRTYRQAA